MQKKLPCRNSQFSAPRQTFMQLKMCKYFNILQYFVILMQTSETFRIGTQNVNTTSLTCEGVIFLTLVGYSFLRNIQKVTQKLTLGLVFYSKVFVCMQDTHKAPVVLFDQICCECNLCIILSYLYTAHLPIVVVLAVDSCQNLKCDLCRQIYCKLARCYSEPFRLQIIMQQNNIKNAFLCWVVVQTVIKLVIFGHYLDAHHSKTSPWQQCLWSVS